MHAQRSGDAVTAHLSRRAMVLGGAGLLAAVAGCARQMPRDNRPRTLTELVTETPFYVAHRGGGRNWPEMTAYAYAQAAALPFVHAIEISVCRSSDGVLVCSHDPDTLRVTGVAHTVAQTDWATLSGLMVTSQYTDDPQQPARPFTRLDEVIGTYIQRLVVFVEPKTLDAAEPLMQALVAVKQPQRTVWKQYVNSPNFTRAKANGFATWGYVLNEAAHLDGLERFAADPAIDLLGIGVTETDDVVRHVVAVATKNRKPVMMWPITTGAERARALTLGCRGLMTSNLKTVPAWPL
ncbi:MAG TPA: glycerophosphodiester phosphodiesterase family protein [Propionicimonas sp.]|uniref:glycerophosphodiester phosphodiesterase n=1 Tax=Propionicimonas sp. TaxID=1955623 RepID=UPI002F3FA817